MNRLNVVATFVGDELITLNEMRIAQYIMNYGPARQRDMAKWLNLPKSSVSRCCIKFQAAGWILELEDGSWDRTPYADEITKALHKGLLTLNMDELEADIERLKADQKLNPPK